MRLINTHTLQLEWTTDEKRKRRTRAGKGQYKYAILSHRWEDEEVTYQDMMSGKGKSTKGYEKIAKMCEKAREAGWNYAWVDSCCINKESSAELTEAINSMWRWYNEAEICFAYLSDVDGACPELQDREDEGRSDKSDERGHEAFASSRWFTRGWTLQELLAPAVVEFYGSTWRLIGTKSKLARTLNAITRVDTLVLQDHTFKSYCTTAMKMSWAAGRKTERMEDRAYSLLGLFDIHIPLVYGEGEKAFIRLQEEIIKTSTDMSILVWGRSGGQQHSLADLIFACSPDQFRDCGSVVPYNGLLHNPSFQLTNRGLHFPRLSVMKGKKETKDFVAANEKEEMRDFVVTNCRLRNDLRGPLALILANYVPGQLFDGEYSIIDGNEHKVNPKVEFNDRVFTCPREHFWATTEVTGQVTLLRRPQNYRSPHLVQFLFKRASMVWLENSYSLQSDRYHIRQIWPERLWNRQSGVMTVPEPTSPGQTTSGCAEIYFPMSAGHQSYFLAFSVTGWGAMSSLKMSLSLISQADAMKGLDTQGYAMEACTILGSETSMVATAERESKFGDDILVIKLSLNK